MPATAPLLITAIFFAYLTYAYHKLKPHWNETVAYTLRCRAEREMDRTPERWPQEMFPAETREGVLGGRRRVMGLLGLRRNEGKKEVI